MKRIVFRPAARTDVLYVYRWYERQRAGLGIQSREQLDAALERIRGRPQAFPVAYRGLRRARLHRSPIWSFSAKSTRTFSQSSRYFTLAMIPRFYRTAERRLDVSLLPLRETRLEAM